MSNTALLVKAWQDGVSDARHGTFTPARYAFNGFDGCICALWSQCRDAYVAGYNSTPGAL